MRSCIETDRLRLGRVTADDAAFFRAYLADPSLARYLPKERPYSAAEAQDFLAERLRHWEAGLGTFIIRVLARGEPIGYAGIERVGGTSFHDIRYGLLPAAMGKGYALEACRALVAEFFASGEADELYGVVLPANEASAKLLVKLGMVPASGVDLYGSARVATYVLNRSDAAKSRPAS